MSQIINRLIGSPSGVVAPGGGDVRMSILARETFLRLNEDFSAILSILDGDGLIRYQSRSIETFLGHSAESRIGRNIFVDSICHPEDRATERAFFDAILDKPGEKVTGLFRLQHFDGSCRDMEAVGQNLLDDPSLRGIYTFYRDVTDRVRAERAKGHLAAIVESSDDAIISKDLDGVITSWNSAAERLYGYTAAEVIGRPIDLLIPEDRKHEEAQFLAKLRRGEHIKNFDSVRVNNVGKPVEVSLTISPVLDSSGRIIGASKIARDIRERKRLDELKLAKEAAEEASRAKDHFLAVLSHELRTPLTPVLATLSYVEGMVDLPELLREEISSIRRNIEIEARLIDDLLDVTRISRGKMALFPEVLDIHASVRAAMVVCQSEVDIKGLEISLALRAKAHHVSADPARLQQAFWNLIKNAIKFTPAEGCIGIRTSNDPQGRLIVQVIDSGVGIDPVFLPRIFNAFEQADQVASRKYGGLGLGLTIAKMLVELQGGELTATSAGLDRGTAFSVTLPTVPSPDDPPPTEPSRPLEKKRSKGLKVLLVDDNPDTLRSIARLLRMQEFEVEVASNAREAVDAANASRFDLLVCDIGLPDGSGLDIMRFARERFGLKGIAFSGYGTEDDINESLAAGFNHHVIKPVRIDPLIELIHQLA